MSEQSYARIGYIFLVGFALFLIALGIHKKAYQAVAPPIYDPISYYSKSQIVWDAIGHHEWKKAFDQFPQRPPGTALILYPIGFSPSIQSFLFRSSFAPILIWAMGLVSIILPNVRNYKGLYVASAITCGLLALPIFYHFEYPVDPVRSYGISVQWGLVDVLQGSVAALALGLMYTGVRKNIKSLIILAWLVGALTFFIKPSGILVLGCLMLVFITECFLTWKKGDGKEKDYIIRSILLFIVGTGITGFSICLAVAGGYLTKEVIDSARGAAKLLIGMVQQSLWIQLKLLVGPVFGYWWAPSIMLSVIASCGASVYAIYNRRVSELAIRLGVSALLCSAALFWWKTMAGQEHRYLFPFIMLVMIWLIAPVFFEKMTMLENREMCLAILYCLVPVITLITLLNIQGGDSPSKLERFFGYNLETGQYTEEVKMGARLLQKSEETQSIFKIYSMGNHVGVLEMCDWVNSIEHPETRHHFTMYRVNDWIHPGIKVREVLSCDYFLVGKNILEAPDSTAKSLIDWKNQELGLANFINKCSENPYSGIILNEESRDVKIFKVRDREEFANEFRNWVSLQEWGDEFSAMNSVERGDYDTPKLRVIDPSLAEELMIKQKSMIPPIDFGQSVTLLAVLRKNDQQLLSKESLTPLHNQEGDLLTFVFRANQKISGKYAVFIHLMDSDKKMFFQHDFQIDPDGDFIAAGTIWTSLVRIPESELTKTSYLGFGIYIPNNPGSFLPSTSQQSDWNGNRVVLPLK